MQRPCSTGDEMSSNTKKPKTTGTKPCNTKAKAKPRPKNKYKPTASNIPPLCMNGERARLIETFKSTHYITDFADHNEWLNSLWQYLHEHDSQIQFEHLVSWNTQNDWISTFGEGELRTREPWTRHLRVAAQSNDGIGPQDRQETDNSLSGGPLTVVIATEIKTEQDLEEERPATSTTNMTTSVTTSVTEALVNRTVEMEPVATIPVATIPVATIPVQTHAINEQHSEILGLPSNFDPEEPMVGTSASFYPTLQPLKENIRDNINQESSDLLLVETHEEEEPDVFILSGPDDGAQRIPGPDPNLVSGTRNCRANGSETPVQQYDENEIELAMTAVRSIVEVRDICKTLHISSGLTQLGVLCNVFQRFIKNNLTGKLEDFAHYKEGIVKQEVEEEPDENFDCSF